MNIPAISNPGVGQLTPPPGDWHRNLPSFYWGGLFICCWLSDCLFSSVESWAQQTIESEYATPTPVEFYLPSVDAGLWHHARDFRGRPLVLLHFSSWSPSSRRILPLWYQRLKPAIERQELSVVAIAHEAHAARAALFCRAHGIDVLVLHDPLTAGLAAIGTPTTNSAAEPGEPGKPIPLGPVATDAADTDATRQIPLELPWVMAFDAHGKLQNRRLTLNLTEENFWSTRIEPPILKPEKHDSTNSDKRSSPFVVADLVEKLRSSLEESDPQWPAIPKTAELLLRHALVAEGPEAHQALAAAIRCYEQIWEAAPAPEVAYRLAVARHRSFELSTGTDTSAFQVAIDFLQLASRGPAPTPFWTAWANSVGPQIDKEFPAYDWLGPMIDQEPTLASSNLFPRPLFAAEQLGPAPHLVLELPESRFASPANVQTTPVPWASVQVDPIWAPSLDPAKPWARLYLRIHFKRGTWSLESVSQLKWSLTEFDSAVQPRWNDLSVQNARHDEDPSEASEIWIETDVWFPPVLFAEMPELGSDTAGGDIPWPSRNAQLIFRGRDPLTGKLDWRQIDFYLPLPKWANVDW